MARISRYPVFNHLRSEASSHVIRYSNGRSVRSGRGLSFWFRPLKTAIAEIPLDDQDLTFLFHGRSADLQEVVAQGVITYRVTEPDTLAVRVDFGVDIATGVHLKTPLDQIAARLTGLAQQYAWALMASTSLRDLVADGVDLLRARIGEGLSADASLAEMGLAIVSVRVSAVQPSAEVEKELAAPTRERIAAEADEAAFARRAAAVDKERAIAENELANRIELARRTAALVEQEGANERKKATETAAAALIAAESDAALRGIGAGADAESIKVVEAQRNAVEAERIATYRDLAPAVLFGLAARDFAGKVETIEHLNITPDLLGTLLGDLVTTRRRQADAGTSET
ncbi:MAG TPA: SPFH domain-containing protein [Candidatus Limnocylindrales bacterium]|nr:SPFH domain-containing protein [Candidatus Limnocylindrales bacterium]